MNPLNSSFLGHRVELSRCWFGWEWWEVYDVLKLDHMLYLVHGEAEQVLKAALPCIPIEALRLTLQTAGRLRQMGPEYWSAVLFLDCVWAFWTLFISMRAYFVFICVCVCSMCACVCMRLLDILDKDGEPGKIAGSLSHTIGQLAFTHRDENTPTSLYLPCQVQCDTRICPLLSTNIPNTHSVCINMHVFVCAKGCEHFQDLLVSQPKTSLMWYMSLVIWCLCVRFSFYQGNSVSRVYSLGKQRSSTAATWEEWVKDKRGRKLGWRKETQRNTDERGGRKSEK